MAKAKENSQQKQYVILGGLLLVMLAVAGKALFNSSAKTAGATVVASSPTTGIGSNDDTPQTPQLSPLTVDWSTDFSRDPFDLEHLLPKAIVNSVDQTQQPPPASQADRRGAPGPGV